MSETPEPGMNVSAAEAGEAEAQRQVWVTPAIQKMQAGDAEVGFSSNVDGALVGGAALELDSVLGMLNALAL